MDIGAFEGEPSVITVTTLADSAGSGTTLRQAIDYVNNIDPQGGVTITFAAGLQGTLDLTQGSLPLITGDLAIVGPGANLLTIDAQGNSRILSIASGADVTISGLTLADGSAAQGGGILNSGGTLTMSDCTVSGNTAGGGSPGIGGGIFNGYAGGYFSGIISGTLTLVGCTLSGNSAIGSGGALWNDSFCNLTMIDCTVSGNGATDIAALALIGSTNTIDACTVSGNTESASRYAAGITVGVDGATINDTIVVGNTDPFGASDLGGGPASGSNNLIGALTNHGSVTGSNNQVGVTNPMLGPLAYNGGTTQTMALLTGSPAIGAGAVALLPPGIITDQRGSPRIEGARRHRRFESGPTTLVVTSLADVNSGAIDLFAPDGITLREAIAFAAADPGDDTIVFSPLLKGGHRPESRRPPTITESLTIGGPGANVLAVNAQGLSGILTIGSGADVTIFGLTLANGSASPAPGGSIISAAGGAIENHGTLAIIGCTLTGNTAVVGGAIANTGTLSLIDSTLSGNSASSYGGAIYSTGTTTLADCTISGNSAQDKGGGIYRLSYSQPGTSLTLADCTISGNATNLGLGGGIFGLNVILNNTIVANSGSGGDIWGTASGSNNLIDDAANAGGLSDGIDGNIVGQDPELGPLTYNGGPTRTMALLPGSKAIGAGDSSLFPKGVATDRADLGSTRPGPTSAPSSTRARRRPGR